MTRLLPIAIVLLTLPLTAAPFALADETHADCEPGQQWVGYTQTDPLRVLVQGILGAQTLNVCEGEQWDGQDSVQPTQNPGNGAGCNKADVVNSAPSANANSLFVGSCMAPDPNNGGADPLSGNGEPLVFRVSFSQSGNTVQLYDANDIALVGRDAVYVGECQANGPGLESAATCSGAGQARSGVYLRDNTPGNVLCQVISAPGITKGHCAESDCDQATYAQGANTGNRQLCGRDNTAVGIDSVLP